MPDLSPEQAVAIANRLTPTARATIINAVAAVPPTTFLRYLGTFRYVPPRITLRDPGVSLLATHGLVVTKISHDETGEKFVASAHLNDDGCAVALVIMERARDRVDAAIASAIFDAD